MTFFADLEVSAIDELPPGRSPVLTKLIPDNRRDDVLGSVMTEVRQGRQASWVCPLVEGSEALPLQTAVATHSRMAQAMPDNRGGIRHETRGNPEQKEDMQ